MRNSQSTFNGLPIPKTIVEAASYRAALDAMSARARAVRMLRDRRLTTQRVRSVQEATWQAERLAVRLSRAARGA